MRKVAASVKERPVGKHERFAPVRVMFVDHGIGFGGAVVSMAELVNNLPESIGSYVLSAQKKKIILPLLKKGRHLFYFMPLNYVLRERLNVRLEKLAAPGWFITTVLKAYALVDLLAGYYYSAFIFWLFKKHRIDLLHINNHVDLNSIRAANWAGIPCIVHCRGFGGIDKGILRYRPFNATARQFIAISQSVADDLRQACISSEKIEVIHNPVHWQRYEAARTQRDIVRNGLAIAADDVVVSIFGRVTEWKGQLEFLEAVELIVADCQKIKVLIVGDASDDVRGYAAKVERLAGQGLLKGRVIFTGYQENVPDYYWASDIVIHNSIIPEPFGRVVIEAMACGRAVVAMLEGGPIDIIEHGHDGLLVPPRNPRELADAMRSLYSSPEERTRMGQNAKLSIEEKFSGEVIAKRVVTVYEKILQLSLAQ